MSYKMISETRVLRIRHEITFGQFTDARAIKSDLAHVPDDAKIVWEESGDDVIVFLQEIEGTEPDGTGTAQ